LKYLKTFDNVYNYSEIDPFMIELELENKITNFIKENNLKYVDNIKIYKDNYYITLGRVGNYDDVLLKYKYPGDEPIEIMIDVPRNKGCDVYKRIIYQINKLTKKDIDVLHTKQAASKFSI